MREELQMEQTQQLPRDQPERQSPERVSYCAAKRNLREGVDVRRTYCDFYVLARCAKG